MVNFLLWMDIQGKRLILDRYYPGSTSYFGSISRGGGQLLILDGYSGSISYFGRVTGVNFLFFLKWISKVNCIFWMDKRDQLIILYEYSGSTPYFGWISRVTYFTPLLSFTTTFLIGFLPPDKMPQG